MKLSIITINYNNKDGLQKTIDSVIGQTWRDFEWIVIDGGSTDGSKELIEKYQEFFSYWCSEPDKGIYNAMNKGIKKAKGVYLNFMNSGDIFCKRDTLKEVFSTTIPSGVSIIYGNYIDMFSDGKMEIQTLKDSLNIYDLYYRPVNHQSTFIRRQLLVPNGYDESYRLLADWKAFIGWMIAGERFFHINTLVAIFDMDGIHNSLVATKQEEINKIRNEVVPQYISSICTELNEKLKLQNDFPEILSVISLCKKSHRCRMLLNRSIKFLFFLSKLNLKVRRL